MSWRVVHVGSPARISASKNQLVIEQEEKVLVPLEDIGVLVLDSFGITVSASALSCISAAKITAIVCDGKHLPQSMLLPYEQHSRQNKVHFLQQSLTEPFCKRLWQKIVVQKIQNQAHVLDVLGVEHSLHQVADGVQSGDTTNREGYAALLYFRGFFPKGVTRESDAVHNALLNYVYALLRADIARTLASYGFLTSLGVHHHSELNNFNLADDFIEPFRPAGDLLVHRVLQDRDASIESICPDDKRALLDIFNKNVIVSNERYSIQTAVELLVKSFVTACEQKSVEALELPNLSHHAFYENPRAVRSANNNSR